MKHLSIRTAERFFTDKLFRKRLRNRIVNHITCFALQAITIHKHNRNIDSLVIYFTLGADDRTGLEIMCGGVMSIASLVDETTTYFKYSDTQVLCCTFHDHVPIFKYVKFKSNVRVFNIKLVQWYFTSVKKLVIHIPECLVGEFADKYMNNNWILSADSVQINILNQNITYMPDKSRIEDIATRFKNVTITTAHKKYCNANLRDYYGVPMHLLSTFISKEKYFYRDLSAKENLILISNDNMELAYEIIDTINIQLPNYKCQVINGLSYEQYKALIAKAKFTITLGEGLDGYFIETFFSGGIAFAIQNNEFFDDQYNRLPCVFTCKNELLQSITSKVLYFDEKEHYVQCNELVQSLLSSDYSSRQYLENIHNFYQSFYTYP